MLQKLSRYYHTLKHLKPIQIRYQIWYRLRNRFFPVKLPINNHTPDFQKLKIKSFPSEKVSHLGHNKFRFLNLEHDFGATINWNYTGHGKLWAYKLNYFEFLHQPEMDSETGLILIRDFISNIETCTEGLEPYPISLRGVNWIKFMAVHDIWPEDVIKNLYAQYQILSQKIEYHLLGNHLMENGFSMLFAGVFFRDDRFINTATTILTEELEEQILNDGAHFELSPMYHCIILQRVLDSINLLKNSAHTKHQLEEKLNKKATLMAGWLREVQFSNGDLPMVNDSVEREFIIPSQLLNYAQELGIEAIPVTMDESGYRMMKSEPFELFVDVGHIGPDYIPGHAHSDTFSFVLYNHGEPFIIDRGVSTYRKTLFRDEERGTASHNTVMISGEEQSDVWGGFRVGRRATSNILVSKTGQIMAVHNGYSHLKSTHIREWKTEIGKVIILDAIHGANKEGEAFFHFHPSCKVEKINDQLFKVNDLTIEFTNAGNSEIVSYPWAAGMNDTIEAKKLIIRFKKELKTVIKQ